MTNDQLLAAWKRKLPNVEPTDQELTAFALGVEVGQVELATQVALVEKCMVAMNENADKGEKAEAELARLKAQPAAWTVLLQQSQANFQKNFGGNVAANWVYNDLRELFADATPVQPAPQCAISPEELAALRRFDETTQDDGSYDVDKEMMKQLAEIGLVRRTTKDYYKLTLFGASVVRSALRTGGAG